MPKILYNVIMNPFNWFKSEEKLNTPINQASLFIIEWETRGSVSNTIIEDNDYRGSLIIGKLSDLEILDKNTKYDIIDNYACLNIAQKAAKLFNITTCLVVMNSIICLYDISGFNKIEVINLVKSKDQPTNIELATHYAKLALTTKKLYNEFLKKQI